MHSFIGGGLFRVHISDRTTRVQVGINVEDWDINQLNHKTSICWTLSHALFCWGRLDCVDVCCGSLFPGYAAALKTYI